MKVFVVYQNKNLIKIAIFFMRVLDWFCLLPWVLLWGRNISNYLLRTAASTKTCFRRFLIWIWWYDFRAVKDISDLPKNRAPLVWIRDAYKWQKNWFQTRCNAIYICTIYIFRTHDQPPITVIGGSAGWSAATASPQGSMVSSLVQG